VVIAIIGILASVVLSSVHSARQRAQYSRALSEMKAIQLAAHLYSDDHNFTFPPDADRTISPGLEPYLQQHIDASHLPKAPFPGSVYDWDSWVIGGEKITQISIRFCEIDCSNCQFPDKPWATDFDCHSSMYLCLEGPCRSHVSKPISHPGHCVNC
jgi:type II secretory pathway pseudopilin PulG